MDIPKLPEHNLPSSRLPAPTLPSEVAADFRSGFVALIGRPNVGKSTLLNRLVGEKVAITSPVPQTTRNRLRAILTTPTAQLVLLDTPGIHKPHHLLGERLVQSARGAIGEVDVVLLLVDGSEPAGRGDGFIVDLLRHCRAPVLVALNKQDLVDPAAAEGLEASYRQLLEQAELSAPLQGCSASTGEGCADLVAALAAQLPLGPHLYPTDTVSDQPEQLLLSELIREQVLTHTREEIPHSVAVQIERIVEDDKRTAVLATVLVERSSQKGILIGKGAACSRRSARAPATRWRRCSRGRSIWSCSSRWCRTGDAARRGWRSWATAAPEPGSCRMGPPPSPAPP